jgi:hypothetical protein
MEELKLFKMDADEVNCLILLNTEIAPQFSKEIHIASMAILDNIYTAVLPSCDFPIWYNPETTDYNFIATTITNLLNNKK